jgi:hypothetical protein
MTAAPAQTRYDGSNNREPGVPGREEREGKYANGQ